jgi:DNA-binding Lrp family transcriptional regulator
MDAVDRGLIHALHVNGRAAFRDVAAVLDVSENTVARRYRKLRGQGLLRVVGTVNGASLGYVAWTIRLRCTPDAAVQVARALADREDTSFVYLLSGGTEVSCSVQSRSEQDQDALLLHKLPRTSRVIAVSAHLLLRAFELPTGWTGLEWLSAEQTAQLTPEPGGLSDEPVGLDEGDKALLHALNRDGRASYAELTAVTGWSESTVKRRMAALRRAGILRFELDLTLAAIGFPVEARLWINAQPAGIVQIAQTLARQPEVSFAALTTGPTNLLVALACRSTAELGRFLTERIAALEGINAIETAPIIRTVKRAGALLL